MQLYIEVKANVDCTLKISSPSRNYDGYSICSDVALPVDIHSYGLRRIILLLMSTVHLRTWHITYMLSFTSLSRKHDSYSIHTDIALSVDILND